MPNSPNGLATRSHFKTSQFNLLGLQISGDIGEYSCYTDRYRRKVVYYYTPPAKPPTTRQVRCRQRFADAHALWKALTPAEKKALEDASRALSLRITGKNLYMSAALTSKTAQYAAVNRQVGNTLPALVVVPN